MFHTCSQSIKANTGIAATNNLRSYSRPMESMRHTKQPRRSPAGYESTFQSDPPGALMLGATPDRGSLSFLIFSPESTRIISSKMAALEEVLVSDLNKMSAEELRSRGWAPRTVKKLSRTYADILKRDQSQGPGEFDRRTYGETQVRAFQASTCLAYAHLDAQAIS
jgi:hypothetical protein